MRSTTVGWLTSMLSVLPVTVDHMWLNHARPEFRDSITHPMEPTTITPRTSPMTSANPIAAEERLRLAELGPGSASGGLKRGIKKGYHQAGAIPVQVCSAAITRR